MKLYRNVKHLDSDIQFLKDSVEYYNDCITSYNEFNKDNPFSFNILNEYISVRRLQRAIKKVDCKEAIKEKDKGLSTVEKAEKTIDYLTNYREFFLGTHIILTRKGLRFESDVIKEKNNKQK